jgi:hypothetical protein
VVGAAADSFFGPAGAASFGASLNSSGSFGLTSLPGATIVVYTSNFIFAGG